MSGPGAAFDRARADHDAGRLPEAEEAYRRLLRDAPGDPDLLHLLGVVAHQRGDPARACTLIGQACRGAPGNAEFARNHGVALAAAGHREQAAGAFERALALAPQDPGARLQLASLHHRAGDPGAALGHYRLALERLPDLADLHNQIGVCLLQLDDIGGARHAFEACLQRDPGHGEARENLARALLRSRRFDEARLLLRTLLDDAPGRDEAWRLLGFAHLHRGELEQASDAFLTPVRRRFAPGASGGSPPADPDTVTRTKLVHDIEQLEQLAHAGRLAAGTAASLLTLHRRALAALPADTPDRFFHETPPVPGFRDAFNRLHLDDPAPRAHGGALGDTLDPQALADAFDRDGWAVADGFLSAAALASLQRFCREPTLWFEKKFRHEVGASLRHGFCCPLLLQVAEEIRARFPALYGRHLFSGCFSYKYFAQHRPGNVHADRGAVSVNLWITPDAANLDPARGGLVIWNKRVPGEYFREQPEEIDALNERLIREPDARPVVIPYRCNRAILFPSDVLHRTDLAHFRDGYEQRRISVTFLFGRPGD